LIDFKPKIFIEAKDIIDTKAYEVLTKLLQNKEVDIFKKCLPPWALALQ
jgi:hypothetical protein